MRHRNWWATKWLDPAAPRGVWLTQALILVVLLLATLAWVMQAMETPERRFRGCALTYGMHWDYETNECVPVGGVQ